MPAAVGAALAALRVMRSPDGPPLLAAVLDNARHLRDGLHERGFAVVAPQPLPDGSDIVTPIVPVLVGDDWKAALLWKALYDAGVFVNTALHPAVPPGGALLRTSVMATHDTRDARPRARASSATVKAAFEAEHGPLPGPGRTDPSARSRRRRLSGFSQVGRVTKFPLLANVAQVHTLTSATSRSRTFERRRRWCRGGVSGS